MTKSTEPHFVLIRRSLVQIESYLPSNKEEFFAQHVLQDAILMRLHTIGESLAQIRRLDDETFDSLDLDSWYKMIGLRNIIAHGYITIDFDIIWQIVTEELPPFADSIETAGASFS